MKVEGKGQRKKKNRKQKKRRTKQKKRGRMGGMRNLAASTAPQGKPHEKKDRQFAHPRWRNRAVIHEEK